MVARTQNSDEGVLGGKDEIRRWKVGSVRRQERRTQHLRKEPQDVGSGVGAAC